MTPQADEFDHIRNRLKEIREEEQRKPHDPFAEAEQKTEPNYASFCWVGLDGIVHVTMDQQKTTYGIKVFE